MDSSPGRWTTTTDKGGGGPAVAGCGRSVTLGIAAAGGVSVRAVELGVVGGGGGVGGGGVAGGSDMSATGLTAVRFRDNLALGLASTGVAASASLGSVAGVADERLRGGLGLGPAVVGRGLASTDPGSAAGVADERLRGGLGLGPAVVGRGLASTDPGSAGGVVSGFARLAWLSSRSLDTTAIDISESPVFKSSNG